MRVQFLKTVGFLFNFLVAFEANQGVTLRLFSNRRQSYVRGICMCFYNAIVQSMFKHVASENAPLVFILQDFSQIFIEN